MGCCGRGKRVIRNQTIKQTARNEKRVVVQRIRRTNAHNIQQKITVARQRIAPSQKCVKCGFPTTMVNIAGRERLQCSNFNCRLIR